MKKLLLGLVLLTGYHLRAADSKLLKDEKAGQENFLQTITKFTREEVGIKKEGNGSASLRFIASKNTIIVLADLVEKCSYLKDMFELYPDDREEVSTDRPLTEEAVMLLIDLWGKAKTVEAFIGFLPQYNFAQLVDLWMAVETLGFDYDTKRSIVGPLQEKIGSDFLRLIEQPEPLDPVILGKIQVTMLRPYLTEQLYKNSWILKNTLQEHTFMINSVAFSPDGKLIATVSNDKTAKVWDMQTGKCLHTFEGHTNSITSVAFSPDGKLVATASNDKTAKVWDVQTGQCLCTFEGHTGFVESVAFSPDGKLVVTGSGDETAKVWDAQTGKLFRILRNSAWVASVAFSPDGKLVATGSWDRTVKLWDVQTGKRVHTLQGHTGSVTSVTFSPDGSTVATGSYDKTVNLWDVQTGKCVRTFQGHADIVNSVAFSPNGQLIATASSDKTAKVWDVQTGQCLHTFEGHTFMITSVAFSPDGKLVAIASSNSVKLWIKNLLKKEITSLGQALTLSIEDVLHIFKTGERPVKKFQQQKVSNSN